MMLQKGKHFTNIRHAIDILESQTLFHKHFINILQIFQKHAFQGQSGSQNQVQYQTNITRALQGHRQWRRIIMILDP